MMTTFFVISGIYIPILSLLIFLLPVPLMVLAARQGARYAFFSLIIVSLLIGTLLGIIYSIPILVIFGPMTLVMSYFIRRKHESFVAIGLGAAATALSVFLLMQLVSMAGGFNIVDEISEIIRETLELNSQLFKNTNLGVVNTEEILNYFLLMIPGLIIVQSIVGAFINYYLTISILRRLRFNDYPLPGFSELRLPGNAALGFLVIFILTYMTKYIKGINYHAMVVNIGYIFVTIFLLQGMAVVNYFLKKVNANKAVRGILLFLIIIIFPLLVLTLTIGLIDSLFDIRKIK